MRFLVTLLLAAPFAAAAPAGAPLSPAHQIASALQAAPDDLRDGAAVLGYKADGKVVELRKGKNDLICLADDPRDDNFSVACYHKDLEPFMARGRELADQGFKGDERHAIRNKDVDEGRVKIPREARMLYVKTGKGFDAASGEIIEPYLRWVVYSPYATSETTGLSTKPGPGPWLMAAGTAGAHIMISPPREKK
jgi:hypothetical protein